MTGNEYNSRLEHIIKTEAAINTKPFEKLLSEALLYGRHENYDFHTSASLASIYTRVSTLRKDTFNKIDRIKRYYIVDLILSQLVDDSLTPQVGTNKVVELGSKNDKVNIELAALSDRIDLNSLVKDIASDLFSYGEYYLSTVIRRKAEGEKVENYIPGYNPDLFSEVLRREFRDDRLDEDIVMKKRYAFKKDVSPYGLLNVLDNVNQGQIVTLTYHGEVATYLMINDQGNLEVREPADFIRFALPGHRLRIDLHKEIEYLTQNKAFVRDPKLLEKIPRYLRVGKSLIWPIIDKLGELELLEALVPATKLNKITAGSIVGFNVPAGMDIDRALEASKRLEGILNRKQGIDPESQQLTVTQIMSAAGRIKTVPIFGEKGTLGPLNFHTQDPEDLLASVQDLRRTICESIGVPYELLFRTEEQSKGQILKKYARYLRKLKGIQLALEEGLRQIAYIHLANADIDFDENEIYVKFFTPLVDVDNLDQLEFTDASVGILSNLLGFITALGEMPYLHGRLNPAAITNYIGAQLSTVGLENIFYTDEELIKLGVNPKEMNLPPSAIEPPPAAPPPPMAPKPPAPRPPAPKPPPAPDLSAGAGAGTGGPPSNIAGEPKAPAAPLG